MADTLNITLDYRDDFRNAFYGSSGFNGFSGTSGRTASEGRDGGHGENGDHGDNGSPGPDLEVFAEKHHLKIGTIADMIHYRSVKEKTVECINPGKG